MVSHDLFRVTWCGMILFQEASCSARCDGLNQQKEVYIHAGNIGAVPLSWVPAAWRTWVVLIFWTRCITEQHGSTRAKWRSNILPESIPCNFSRCAIYLNHQTALNKWGKSTLAKGSCSTFTCHREGAEYATLKGDPPFALFCAGLCQIMPMNSCPMGMSTAVFPGA